MRIASPSGSRAGLSLLEVLVALAIFLSSLAGLFYLVTLSGKLAQAGQMRTRALQIAQSKLAQVTWGAIALSSQADQPCDEDPEYHWSIDAEQGSTQGLWNVTVKVTRPNMKPIIEVSLNQMILDPANRGTIQDPAATAAAADAASQGSNNSGNGGTSSPSSNPSSSGGKPSGSGAKPSAPVDSDGPAMTPVAKPTGTGPGKSGMANLGGKS
jgi:type II secretion system protein I